MAQVVNAPGATVVVVLRTRSHGLWTCRAEMYEVGTQAVTDADRAGRESREGVIPWVPSFAEAVGASFLLTVRQGTRSLGCLRG